MSGVIDPEGPAPPSPDRARSRLRAEVRAALTAHGLAPASDDAPEALHERLSDVYLEDVRRLRARQRAGEIALRDYAREADALARRYPLLALPLVLWTE